MYASSAWPLFQEHCFQYFQPLLVYYNINRRGRGFWWVRWKQVSAITPCPVSLDCWSGHVLQSVSNWSNFFMVFFESHQRKLEFLSQGSSSCSVPPCLSLSAAQKSPVAHTLQLSEQNHLSAGSHLPQWATVKQKIEVHCMQLSKWVTLWLHHNVICSTYTFAVRWHLMWLRKFRYFSKVKWLMEDKSHWKWAKHKISWSTVSFQCAA